MEIRQFTCFVLHLPYCFSININITINIDMTIDINIFYLLGCFNLYLLMDRWR